MQKANLLQTIKKCFSLASRGRVGPHAFPGFTRGIVEVFHVGFYQGPKEPGHSQREGVLFTSPNS